MLGEIDTAPYLWNLSLLCEEFPKWDYMDAEDALRREPERGWPLRQILSMRSFARKFGEIKRAEELKQSGPTDPYAMKVYAAIAAADKRALGRFRAEQEASSERRDAPGSPQAGQPADA